MKFATQMAMCAATMLFLQACGDAAEQGEEQSIAASEPTTEQKSTEARDAALPNVVEYRAVGMTFEGPTEIPSGWTTMRFVNTSDMIHFAMIDVPPEGIDAQIFSDTAAQYFQDAMDAMNAGDAEGVNAAFGMFPEWIGHLGRNGGPGFLSPGRTSEATVYLEPGHYILECYVKTGGIFHTTSPGDGRIAMMLDITVTDEKASAPEPSANATIAITKTGYEITDGALRAGQNTIRVDFVEQEALPSFVGYDVHVMKVENEESIDQANAWLDWQAEYGLESPSPVTFLGGINDMPQGTHGYFTVDLGPGDYALIAEIPNPAGSGHVMPFTIPSE